MGHASGLRFSGLCTMASTLSIGISARITSLEFEAKEVYCNLENFLTYSEMFGQDSLTQSEQTELLQ